MERFQVLSRASDSVLYGAPVFLIRRKSDQEPARLLASVTELNAVMKKGVNYLPNIQRLVDEITMYGSNMISTIDLSNGFYSLSIYPKHRKRACIATAIGLFYFNRAVMGLSNSPARFSEAVYVGMHTQPETGERDHMEGCYNFIDDIIVTSKQGVDEYDSFAKHYNQLDKLLGRLAYHKFKISPGKLRLFQKEAVVLGYVLANNQIKLDPARLEKIKKAEFPKSRKQAMVVCGFLSSIKSFSSIGLGRCHAELKELTRSTVPFAPQERHRKAFRLMKEYLTTEPFVLDVPTYSNVKVIYSDASSACIGYILLELELEMVVEARSEVVDGLKDLPAGSVISGIADDQKLRLKMGAENKVKGPIGLFHAIGDQVKILALHNFPKQICEVRAAVVSQLDTGPFKTRFSKWKENREGWQSLMDEVIQGSMPDWLLPAALEAAAEYFERDIILISYDVAGRHEIIKVSGKGLASRKPAFWLGWETETDTFSSLANLEANQYSPFTVNQAAHNDIRSMNQHELAQKARELISSSSVSPHRVRVIQYAALTVPDEARSYPIWELECLGLLTALNKFKPWIIASPCTLAITDSRVAYFLFSKATLESKVKVKRWSLLIQAEFPMVVFWLMAGTSNCSDWLSRIVELPETVAAQMRLRNVDIADIPELHGKIMSHEEIAAFCEANPQIASEGPELKRGQKPKDVQARVQVTLSENSMKILTGYTDPVRVLADRIMVPAMAKAQDEQLVKDWHNYYQKMDGYSINRGLLTFRGRVIVPESLRGVVVAYAHLLCGHAGRDKTVKYAQERWTFTGMVALIERFVQGCQVCVLTNPDTTSKLAYGTFPTSEGVFERIFIDIFEDMPDNALKVKHLMVCTDSMSKFMLLFPMTNKTASQILAHLKTLLQVTGMSTKTITTDNAPLLREKGLKRFLNCLGVTLSSTIPMRSESRGAVEVVIKNLHGIFTKLMAGAEFRDVSQVFWLASVMINSAVHSTTGVSPMEMVYGRNMVDFGPWGLNYGSRVTVDSTSSTDLRPEVQRLREVLEKSARDAREHVLEIKEKYLTEVNKHRKPAHGLEPGKLIFVKRFDKPPVGINPKFRVRYHPSPYVVVDSKSHSVLAKRLSDGYTTLLHPDFCKEFKDKDPSFQDLPKEVLRIVGKPLTEEDIAELAVHDPMDVLMLPEWNDDPGTEDKKERELRGRKKKQDAQVNSGLTKERSDDSYFGETVGQTRVGNGKSDSSRSCQDKSDRKMAGAMPTRGMARRPGRDRRVSRGSDLPPSAEAEAEDSNRRLEEIHHHAEDDDQEGEDILPWNHSSTMDHEAPNDEHQTVDDEKDDTPEDDDPQDDVERTVHWGSVIEHEI